MTLEAHLLRAAAAQGVPVAPLVTSGDGEDGVGAPYLVMERIEGETIPRKILRDPGLGRARAGLAAQCARALAGIHRIPATDVPGLEGGDQVAQQREFLDLLGEPHPAFELGLRWLEANRPPPSPETVVHGDFRHGNLIVGPDGLRAVLDWELAHAGDPLEDLGWLCVKAWRFGSDLPVGGFGTREDLFAAYEEASGRPLDPDAVHWWEVLGTLKWGIICIIQAASHLTGATRSVELAAIGRRVCENEHDLLELLP
jgi:aminoglycoside phosphotransferase (APT) family kinase protein